MFILLEAVAEVDTSAVPAAQEVSAVVVPEHLILLLVEHLIPVVAVVDLVVQLLTQVTELLATAEVVWLFFVIQTHMLPHRLPQDLV
jgi:hypothetical protein